MPTSRLVLFVAPGESRLNEPLAVRPLDALMTLALSASEKAVVDRRIGNAERLAHTESPTWKFPKIAGSGMCALALASRKTDPRRSRFVTRGSSIQVRCCRFRRSAR
jgi:hypothetical protein